MDLLALTPEFLRSHPDLAEDVVRAALSQGADVEMLSSPAAEQLDQASEGIAARRRFAIDESRCGG